MLLFIKHNLALINFKIGMLTSLDRDESWKNSRAREKIYLLDPKFWVHIFMCQKVKGSHTVELRSDKH